MEWNASAGDATQRFAGKVLGAVGHVRAAVPLPSPAMVLANGFDTAALIRMFDFLRRFDAEAAERALLGVLHNFLRLRCVRELRAAVERPRGVRQLIGGATQVARRRSGFFHHGAQVKRFVRDFRRRFHRVGRDGIRRMTFARRVTTVQRLRTVFRVRRLDFRARVNLFGERFASFVVGWTVGGRDGGSVVSDVLVGRQPQV